jgi:hypothetical protein
MRKLVPRLLHLSTLAVVAVVIYWLAWAASHHGTGLQHGPESNGASSARVRDVQVSDLEGYWSSLLGIEGADPSLSHNTPARLYVIRGNLENISTSSIDHVELRFDLLDPDGTVVYRETGFNRSAESLRRPVDGDPPIEPIPAGATDSFRMLLFGDELPEFADIRVEVVQVE